MSLADNFLNRTFHEAPLFVHMYTHEITIEAKIRDVFRVPEVP